MDSQQLKPFQDTFNRHGYGFHYSVLKQADDLFGRRQSNWAFEVAEFPVEGQGFQTRIDFILRRRVHRHPWLMVAECKRANPAVSNWFFLQAPYVVDSGLPRQEVILERLSLDEHHRMRVKANIVYPGIEGTYHIAQEVKTGAQGDPGGTGRGAIEEAATQVFRGLNGLVNSLAHNTQLFGGATTLDLLPVIFTTAQVWVSSADLRTADPLTGNLDLSTAQPEQRDWILYNYHTSPGLKHSQSSEPQSLATLDSLTKIMRNEFIRTIAVVSASGIASFLEWSSLQDVY